MWQTVSKYQGTKPFKPCLIWAVLFSWSELQLQIMKAKHLTCAQGVKSIHAFQHFHPALVHVLCLDAQASLCAMMKLDKDRPETGWWMSFPALKVWVGPCSWQSFYSHTCSEMHSLIFQRASSWNLQWLRKKSRDSLLNLDTCLNSKVCISPVHFGG